MQERVRTRKEEIGWDFPVSEAESTELNGALWGGPGLSMEVEKIPISRADNQRQAPLKMGEHSR